MQSLEDYLKETFDKRQLRLILNCIDYADSDPAGLPGHNLMVIVSILAKAKNIDRFELMAAIANYGDD